MGRNIISSLGASIVSSALQTPNSLSYLEMSHFCLGDEGAINVAAGMKFMPFLEYLCLNCNSFGPKGASAIGNEIKYLTELQGFDISHNNVRPSGTLAIAHGITHCTKLKKLFMMRTNIDIDSATHIILSLKNIRVGDFSRGNIPSESSSFSVSGLIFPEDERALVNRSYQYALELALSYQMF